MQLGDELVAILVVAATTTAVLAALAAAVLWLRLARLRHAVAMAGNLGSGASVEGGEVRNLDADPAGVTDDVMVLPGRAPSSQGHSSGSRIGLVRYDAFGEAAGRLSFSVAVVDERGSGVVITGLNTRSESRCYAKELQAGDGDVVLSPEEQRAIEAALAPAAAPGVPAASAHRRAS